VTPDDRFLVQPIQGVLSPSDPPPAGLAVSDYNRDYPSEHSRRVIVLDIQKLLRARTLVKCDAPPVEIDENGIIQRITARNNGAEDCPTVTGTLNLDSRENFATHSGPHFVAFDHETRRVAASNYFVQLTPFDLPGLHEAGDDRVCMAKLTQTGQLVLDTAFKDELTGRPCVAMIDRSPTAGLIADERVPPSRTRWLSLTRMRIRTKTKITTTTTTRIATESTQRASQ